MTLAVGAAILIGVGGCRPQNQFQPPPPPKITVAKPLRQDVIDTIDFTGTTRPIATVELRARVEGYLERIAFTDGATVKAGDLLFVIEKAPFQAAVNVAKANVQKAEAALQLADATLARTQQLVTNNAASQQQLDVDAANRATAAAELAATQAALTQADLNLGYTEIRAPIGGRIGRHLIDVGNLVHAEQSLLGVIESIAPIYAYFNVSERDLLRFMDMMRQHKLPDPTKEPPTLYLGLANEQGFPHEGHLDFRELGVDAGTGTILRRAVYDNADQTLIPGLFVRIRAGVGRPQAKLLVDRAAVGTDQRGDFVLVVNEKNIVEYRTVRLGIAVGDLQVIEDGVGADDRVVLNGLQRARPGSPVAPEESQIEPPSSNDNQRLTAPQPTATSAAKPRSTAPAKKQPDVAAQ
ncbi:MAG: efflux RND transporter periplasmic adaptor subunit [Pirellulales bacterium]